MKFVFDNPEIADRLGIVLSEWMGTPYRHKCCVKQKGCDCIHFVAGVLNDLGIYKYIKRKMPDYPRDWHLHNTRQLLCEEIKRQLNVIDIEGREFKNGDILLFTYGMAASHSSIYYNKYAYQALNRFGVDKIHISDKGMIQRLTFHLRLIE